KPLPPRHAELVEAPGVGSSNPHAEILDLEVILDPVLRALAAVAAFLHSAERGDFRRDEPFVDTDDAELQRFRDAPNPRDVPAIEIGRETELGVVCQRNRLLFIAEADDGCHRAEDFLPEQLHLRLRLRDYRRLIKCLAQRMALAAKRNARTL